MSWTGKILRVNLNRGTCTPEPLNMEWAEKYLGQRGLASKYLVEEIDPKCDPLGPGNNLIMATGPLTGPFFHFLKTGLFGVGCKVCTIACPFGTVNYNASTGKVIKCDLCGGDPACAKACPPEAIIYADRLEVFGAHDRANAGATGCAVLVIDDCRVKHAVLTGHADGRHMHHRILMLGLDRLICVPDRRALRGCFWSAWRRIH